MAFRDLNFPDGFLGIFEKERNIISTIMFVRNLALHERFSGASTEEEFFSYLWNRKELQSMLSHISQMSISCKTKEVSEEARNNGNIYYRSKHFELALLHYNISILTAPHPPVGTSDETNDLCTGQSEREPHSTVALTETKVDSVTEKTEINSDINSGNEHNEFSNIADCRENRLKSLHEMIVMLQQTVISQRDEITLLREQVTNMSDEIVKLREKVETKEDQGHCAARPSVKQELFPEVEKEGVDNSEYRELALGYANRSAVLLELEQYEECIRDIDLALKYGYPKSSQEKLRNRRKKCEAALKTGPYEKLWTSRCSCREVALTNAQILGASDAVGLDFSLAKGRHLVAKTDIRPGDILMDHEALIDMSSEQIPVHCKTCMTQCFTPLPCPTCSAEIFCSEACMAQGYADGHWKECTCLSLFSQGDISLRLVERLLLRTTFVKLKDQVPKLRAEAETKSPSQLGFNEDGVYDPSDYRTFYHLLTNKNNRGMDFLFQKCIKAVILLKFLLESGKFFINEAGIPFTPSSEELIFTGGILFHHCLNLDANNVIALDLEATPGSSSFNVGKRGMLFSPIVALMNHSCYPSAIVQTCGKRAIVMATRSIKAGEEVTLSYIENRGYRQPETERRQKLLCNFFFLCHCVACEGKWSELTRVNSTRTFKCLACGGPVSQRLKACMECNLDFLKSSGENVYDLDEIEGKIRQATESFMEIIMHNPVHKFPKEIFKRLVSVIEIFDKYVYPPDEVHEAAQRTLVEWFAISSRHYIKRGGF